MQSSRYEQAIHPVVSIKCLAQWWLKAYPCCLCGLTVAKMSSIIHRRAAGVPCHIPAVLI